MSSYLKFVAIAWVSVLLTLGCSGTPASGRATARPVAPTPATDSRAADLRTRLDLLLAEHTVLAAEVSKATLGNRADERTAYGDQVLQNVVELGNTFGLAFGPDAESRFDQVWSAESAYLGAYAAGAASGDRARQDQAINDLMTSYVPQLAGLTASVTDLSVASVAALATDQVVSAKTVMDDQAAKNWAAAYADLRRAYASSQALGDRLAAAVVRQRPATFPGDGLGNAAGFRVRLNLLFQEHAYLAGAATGAATGARPDEFAAAATALTGNAADLGSSLGAVLGTASQGRFDQLWSAHNTALVDYTSAVIARDGASQDQALARLVNGYVNQLAEFVSQTTALPSGAVADAARSPVLATKDMVDAQAVKDFKTAAVRNRAAARQLQPLSDPLAAAIVKKLPARFA